MRTQKSLALLVGIAFGFVLGWSQATEYDTIHAMHLLKDAYVFLLMGSAMVTAALGLFLLRRAKARALSGDAISFERPRPRGAHVAGAAVFGIGWALAGTCPGPAAAQIGRGELAGLFTVAGLFAGIALRGWAQARSAKPIEAPAGPCGAPSEPAHAQGVS